MGEENTSVREIKCLQQMYKYIVYIKLIYIIQVWLSSSKRLCFFLKTLQGRHLITIGIVSQVCDATTLNRAKP